MSWKSKFLDRPSLVCNQLRLAGELTDAVIVAEGVKFQVHKIILCGYAKYFCNLFTQEDSLDKEVFDIPGISAEIMQVIIEYAYTKPFNATESNALELLLTANQLGAPTVVHACCIFLEGVISQTNCIGIWRYTTTVCPQPVLHFNIYSYILQHFKMVALGDEFLQLSVEELSNIIADDNLIVSEESLVYEAVLRWTSHSPEERKIYFMRLFCQVRLALLNIDYIRDNLLLNLLEQGQLHCLPIHAYALKIKSHQSLLGPGLTGISNYFARPRLPTAILLAIGGWSRDGELTNGIEAYDVRADCWMSVINNSQSHCANHGTIFLNGYVYSVGGCDKVEYLSSVRRFDPITGNWKEVAPMYFRRCLISVTVLNGCIYAMGGYDGHISLTTAEYYRPEINQWSLFAAMREPRSNASCTTLNNKIYICGGFNGHDHLQTAECYSMETQQWTMISPMIGCRSGIRVIAYAGRVYAVGGFDGSSRLRSVEAYNPDTNLWTNVASMIYPRSNFGIEVVEDRLYVVGGFNGLTTINNVECYDSTRKKWSKVCDMAISRSHLSCCVISGLPNMNEYVIPRAALPRLPMESAG